MKKLMLLRHGKSDWAADFGTDHERPLASRGEKAARLMGRFITSAEMIPGRLISSSAARALSTARLAMEAGNWNLRLEVSDRLYDTSPGSVIAFLNELDAECECLMLVGHNPVWENLLSLLVSGGRFRMPTAALALVKLPLRQWSELVSGRGTLGWLVTPKLLKKVPLKD